MKRLIVALFLAAVLSGMAWGLTAALPLSDGTRDSGHPGLANAWDPTAIGAFEYFGPP